MHFGWPVLDWISTCYFFGTFQKNFGTVVIHFAGDNFSGPGGTRDGGVK